MPHDKKTVGEDWRESAKANELREYIDKVFKPRQQAMKNLDREIIIDFIAKERTSLLSRIKEEVEKLKELWGRIDGTDNERIAYNQGLIDAAAIIQSYIEG